MKKSFLFIVMILILTFTAPIYAVDINAKASGMGGAFTAISDDASAIYWNPAGLTEIAHMGLSPSVGIHTSTRTSWEKFNEVASGDILDSPGNAEVSMAAILGLGMGNYGAGIIASGQVLLTAEEDNKADGKAQYILAYTVSTARKVTSPKWNLGAISVGLNFKALEGRRYNYDVVPTGESTYNVDWVDARGTGYSADMGIRIKFTDSITIGLMIRDLISNMTWRESITSSSKNAETGEEEVVNSYTASSQERFDALVRAGVAVDVPYIGTTLAADMERDGSLYFGLEKRLLFNGISLRAGKSMPANGEGLITLGAGINLGPVSVDASVGSKDEFKEDLAAMVSGKIRF